MRRAGMASPPIVGRSWPLTLGREKPRSRRLGEDIRVVSGMTTLVSAAGNVGAMHPTRSVRHLRLGSPSPRAVDFSVALALGAWAIPEIPWWWRGHGDRVTMWILVGVALVQSLAFLWRRSRPATVFLFAAAGSGLKLTMLPDSTSALAAILLAGFGLGAYGDQRGRLTARYLGRAAAAMSLLLAAGVFGAHYRPWGWQSALLAAALLTGEVSRLRQDAGDAAIRAAELAERNRIARELHDTLAHLLSGIALTAGAARSAARHDHHPETEAGSARKTAALSVIETSARDALGELSSLLGVLRKDSDPRLVLRPAPAIGDLPELLDEFRSSGATARLSVHGDVERLPAAIGRAAYRIVQEALTNARRHAPGAPVHVTLVCGGQQLRVEVVNQASSPRRVPDPSRAPGNGLRGMRERVQLYDGELRAGPISGGGYRITATLHDNHAGRPR
jgi:signal transduction histidine kinase